MNAIIKTLTILCVPLLLTLNLYAQDTTAVMQDTFPLESDILPQQVDTIPSQVDSIPGRNKAIPKKRGRDLSKLREAKTAVVDSSRLLSYTLSDINSRDSFRIKGLEKYFQQYDPARNRDFDYGHLGNTGSAAYPLALHLKPRIGFRLGYTQYDLYFKNEDNIRFFDQVRPFSELFFSGGESQSDLRFKALFSRSFANNVNWVVDYERISQQGFYSNQGVKQTSLVTSLSYREKKRFSGFLTYIINSGVEEVNGGVVDVTTLDSIVYRIRNAVPVYSEDAVSRLQNHHIIFNGFYRLGQDSTTSKFTNNIQYQFQTFNEFFRYTDESTSDDAELYQNYWVSERGIRNYNEQSRIRNGVYLNSKFKDYYNFKAGLVYDYNAFEIISDKNTFNELYLIFKGGIQLKKRFAVNADFYYGLFDVANEFSLDANANLRLTKTQGFNFNFLTARYGVNYVQEGLGLNQSIFYQEDVVPIILQTLGAEYYNNRFNFKIGGRLQNTFNFQYFDEESLPVQESGLFTVSLIYGSYDLKFRSLMIENFLFLQNTSKDIVNLPTAFTKNSISYYGRIFKGKMLLKTGLDFRYIFNEYLPKYNPIIGQYYLNTDETTTPYLQLDARISFKVSSFTTFAKYENISSLWRDDVEQQVVNYPQYDGRFRFGILWNLWN